MDFIKDEIDKEFNAVGFRSQRRLLRPLKQVGTTTKPVDEAKKGLMPGKRVSKTGKVYWETRKNRTDSKNSNI